MKENYKLYTTFEVSDLLRVDPHTIRIYLRKGIIKGVKIGKYWRIPEKEVKRLVFEEVKQNG